MAISRQRDLGKSGIYIICNHKNGKFYVGSSSNLYGRSKDHFYRLRKNTHPNTHLQRSFNKYGRKAFEFKVVEYCNNFLEREQSLLDLGLGDYNVASDVTGGKYSWNPIVQINKKQEVMEVWDNPNKAICTLKLSTSHLKNVLNKKGITCGGFYWCYLENIGSFKPIKPNYKGGSPEISRKNIKKAHKALKNNHPRRREIYQVDTKQTFSSITEASKILNIPRRSIQECLSGNNKTAYGKVFKYIEND